MSFGGHLEDIDGGLVCEWQVNLHNVGGTDLDKAKFHTTDCFDLTTWPPDTYPNFDPSTIDGVARFYADGTFNGESGYTAIFRMEDWTEPSVMDTLRIEIYKGAALVYDTSAGDFTDQPSNVGDARTLLDNGNIQISFYE